MKLEPERVLRKYQESGILAEGLGVYMFRIPLIKFWDPYLSIWQFEKSSHGYFFNLKMLCKNCMVNLQELWRALRFV